MPIDVFSPAVLNRVVQDLKDTAGATFLLDRFFPETSVSDQEEIFFDVLTGKPRLAPFVSPLVEGQIVQSLGYATKSFRPAYVKDKRVFEDGKPIRRMAGQPIAVNVDPMAARMANVATESADQIAMINRRMEWMAAQVLRTGSVTISGEKYPTTVVNFGRDAALTVALATTARWNDSGPTPLEDLETWAGLIRTKSGASPTDVVMAQDTWAAFRKNADVKALLDASKGLSPRSSMDLGPNTFQNGATFMGQIGAFDVWVYADAYVDDAGATQLYLPSGGLIMGGAQIEGVRHFGAIKDEAAGFQALDYYQKSWLQPDPAARFLMLQSAPLVVPYRVNASLFAQVF